jgi:hypothetical protein
MRQAAAPYLRSYVGVASKFACVFSFDPFNVAIQAVSRLPRWPHLDERLSAYWMTCCNASRQRRQPALQHSLPAVAADDLFSKRCIGEHVRIRHSDAPRPRRASQASPSPYEVLKSVSNSAGSTCSAFAIFSRLSRLMLVTARST